MATLSNAEALEESGQEAVDGKLSVPVRDLLMAYTPTLMTTVHIERSFNSLRTSERLLRNSNASSMPQQHMVTLRSLVVQDTGFRVRNPTENDQGPMHE